MERVGLGGLERCAVANKKPPFRTVFCANNEVIYKT